MFIMKFLILQNHGKFSLHNTNCWKQKEYIGFGVSAHSFLNGVRYSNNEKYERVTDEVLDIDSQKKEYMMLGLRMLEGVSVKRFKSKFGENPIFAFKNEISKLVAFDLIEVDGDFIKLTDKGLDFANIVFQEFV